MNPILEAMKTRRSIRKFKPDMPEREAIEQIIEAGRYAASGKGAQATITLAITNKETRDRLMTANARALGHEGIDPFYGAPVILVVLRDKSFFTSIYDGSLVMGNMMLAAHALGLGSIWIHRAKEEFEQPEWQALLKDLGIEGEWEGVGNLALGYIEGEPPKAAPRKDGRVFFVD
ncbi:MAG: nitroreductase [Clostridia bacterium]|nr:nitroreductase [Clostridia bacterium]